MSFTTRELLKECTFPLHQWLERVDILQNIKNEDSSIETYEKLLENMYSFISSLEDILKVYKIVFLENDLLDFEDRVQKTNWLEKDLIEFKMPIIKKNVNFKTLNTFSSVVGALYVLEGSSMGGMQLTKILKLRYGENITCEYLQSYKNETIDKWNLFCTWLDNTSLNQHDVLLGASEVFIRLREHLYELR